MAKVLILAVTVRDSYDTPEGVKREIEESLMWLTEDHHAAKLEWREIEDDPSVPDRFEDDGEAEHKFWYGDEE